MLTLASVVACRVEAQDFRVTGRVVRGSTPDSTPVAGTWAVLHEITLTGGGPVDSQRTDRRGVYRVTAPQRDTAASYLVSVRYAGIAHFGDPVDPRAGPRADVPPIAVFDTSSTEPSIVLGQRHVIARAANADGSRRMIELLVLYNQGMVTRIAADSTSPVWQGALPAAAVQFEVGESDVSDRAITRRGDSVVVLAPIPPGERQLLVSYVLPASTRELRIPIDQPVGRLNVMVEDTSAIVSAPALESAGVEHLEGMAFRRYAGERVPAGTPVVVLFSGRGVGLADFWWVVIALAVLALATGLWWWWRRARAQPILADDGADALAAQIAALDDEFAGRETPEYRQRREELKRRLAAALARNAPAR